MNSLASSHKLRIATWNLDYLKRSGMSTDACRAKIKEIQADVWVITETPRDFDLGSSYNCIAESKAPTDLTEDKRWVKVWVKNSLAGRFLREDSNDSERTACAVGDLSTGQPFIVYGTVLPWLGSKWGEVPAKDGQAFLSALKTQSNDWVTLRDEHKESFICVVGDFNQDLLEEGHFYGSKDGREALKKALSLSGFGLYTGGKNDPIAPYAPGNAAIDHICIRVPESRVIDSVTTSAWTLVQDGSRISDHFGIMMDIEYR